MDELSEIFQACLESSQKQSKVLRLSPLLSQEESHIPDFMCRHKNKSNHDRSGKRDGQATEPHCLIHVFGKVTSRLYCISRPKWAGAPSCWKHLHLRRQLEHPPASPSAHLAETSITYLSKRSGRRYSPIR